MIYRYETGFDLSKAPWSTFELTVATSSSSVTITAAEIYSGLGSRKCCPTAVLYTVYPYKPESPTETVTDSNWAIYGFVEMLQSALNIKQAADSWIFLTDVWIDSDGHLVISNDEGFAIGVLPANEFTQWFTGHRISDYVVGEDSIVGAYPMRHVLVPEVPYTAKDSGLYMAEPMGSVAVPCSGVMPYGISTGSAIVYHDFSHIGESKASVYGDITGESTPRPFGWTDIIRQASAGYPLVQKTDDNQKDYIYFDRGIPLAPSRMVSDDDTYYEVPLRLIYHGYTGSVVSAKTLYNGGSGMGTYGCALTPDGTELWFINATTGEGHSVSVLGGAAPLELSLGSGAKGIDFAGSYVYWSRSGGICRRLITGGSTLTLTTDVETPAGLDIYGSKLYFVDLAAAKLRSMLLTSPFTPADITDVHSYDLCIDPDGTLIWYTDYDNGLVLSIPIAGGEALPVIDELTNPTGIYADENHVYWVGSNGDIMRAHKDGSGIVTFYADAGSILSIRGDDDWIFYTNTTTGQVKRVPKTIIGD